MKISTEHIDNKKITNPFPAKFLPQVSRNSVFLQL